jgi:hypothetical protein
MAIAEVYSMSSNETGATATPRAINLGLWKEFPRKEALLARVPGHTLRHELFTALYDMAGSLILSQELGTHSKVHGRPDKSAAL